MSKKRPRGTASKSRAGLRAGSKLEPEYWRGRLFKSHYTYKGEQREVRHWSVKIQHHGERKTFALQSSGRSAAAAEACALYRALVLGDGEAATARVLPGRASGGGQVGEAAEHGPNRFEAGYWAQRLIHRQYTMSPGPGENPEFSVRIDEGGTGCFFPLATNDPDRAAERALQVYQTIVSHGWDAANRRFPRELTVAFHWLDVPLAWTYTTIHTLNTEAEASFHEPLGAPTFLSASGNQDTRPTGISAPQAARVKFPMRGQPAAEPPQKPPKNTSDACPVAVAEPNSGIRRALAWCINRMDGLSCIATFASAEEALRTLRLEPVRLLLVNHNLSGKSGTACLDEMKMAASGVAGVLYSVYEDSEELFRRTPGGAGTYLLRRTGPTQFLEPIRAWLTTGPLPVEPMASAAWQYFKESITSMPVGGTARQLASLTPREHEVLGLLSQGHPDKEIADQLGISVYTVHEHVRKIFDKLGAHNRTEAAVKFLQK